MWLDPKLAGGMCKIYQTVPCPRGGYGELGRSEGCRKGIIVPKEEVKLRGPYFEKILLTCCDVQTDLNYPDTPKAAAWVGDSLIICIKKELYHTTVSLLRKLPVY